MGRVLERERGWWQKISRSNTRSNNGPGLASSAHTHTHLRTRAHTHASTRTHTQTLAHYLFLLSRDFNVQLSINFHSPNISMKISALGEATPFFTKTFLRASFLWEFFSGLKFNYSCCSKHWVLFNASIYFLYFFRDV